MTLSRLHVSARRTLRTLADDRRPGARLLWLGGWLFVAASVQALSGWAPTDFGIAAAAAIACAALLLLRWSVRPVRPVPGMSAGAPGLHPGAA